MEKEEDVEEKGEDVEKEERRQKIPRTRSNRGGRQTRKRRK
jgi:hypothetical protein